MAFADSAKCRNLAATQHVALHWQVSEVGDGVEVWGSASIHDDVDTKRRLWNGVFDDDLNAFAPGGPDGSPQVAFVAVAPERAVSVKACGAGGIERWKA